MIDSDIDAVFASEQRLISAIQPILSKRGITSVFFPSVKMESLLDTDSILTGTIPAASHPDPGGEIEESAYNIFSIFTRTTEEVLYIPDTSICAVCGTDLAGVECSLCGTPMNRAMLKRTVKIRPYLGGNQSIEQLNSWQYRELVRICKLLGKNGISDERFRHGIVMKIEKREYSIRYSGSWYLYRSKSKLRETRGRYQFIMQLWKLWNKELFRE